MRKIFFSSTDGLQLCGVWHLPKQKTKKAIILAHGITVDKDESGLFVKLADKLCDDGFAVFRFDFRGHGESEGRSLDMTIQGEIEDLRAAVNYVISQSYEEIGLLGASFGGGVSTLFTGKNPEKLKCLCLWNPTLNYEHTYLNPTNPSIIKVKAHIPKDFEEKGWSELYSRKYKIGKELFEGMKNLFPFEELKKIKIPTIIFHGDLDTKVPFEDSKKYVNNLTGVKEFVALHGSDHGFHKEPFSGEVIQKTCEFFKKYLDNLDYNNFK